jgi:hypothetical protein
MLRSRRLLAVALLSVVASASCATHHSPWARPEVRARVAALRSVGLVSPRVATFEEDSVGGMEVDASNVVKELGDAFAAELAKHGTTVVRIAPDDPAAIAASDRFAQLTGFGELGDGRTGSRDDALLDPSTAQIADLAVPDLFARYGVDAVWLVEAETVRSARVRGDVGVVLTVPFLFLDLGLSRQAARASLQAALVDASGAVLFSCSLDDLPPEGTPTDCDDGGPRALAADLQDPVVAWAYAAAAVRTWRDAVR